MEGSSPLAVLSPSRHNRLSGVSQNKVANTDKPTPSPSIEPVKPVKWPELFRRSVTATHAKGDLYEQDTDEDSLLKHASLNHKPIELPHGLDDGEYLHGVRESSPFLEDVSYNDAPHGSEHGMPQGIENQRQGRISYGGYSDDVEDPTPKAEDEELGQRTDEHTPLEQGRTDGYDDVADDDRGARDGGEFDITLGDNEGNDESLSAIKGVHDQDEEHEKEPDHATDYERQRQRDKEHSDIIDTKHDHDSTPWHESARVATHEGAGHESDHTSLSDFSIVHTDVIGKHYDTDNNNSNTTNEDSNGGTDSNNTSSGSVSVKSTASKRAFESSSSPKKKSRMSNPLEDDNASNSPATHTAASMQRDRSHVRDDVDAGSTTPAARSPSKAKAGPSLEQRSPMRRALFAPRLSPGNRNTDNNNSSMQSPSRRMIGVDPPAPGALRRGSLSPARGQRLVDEVPATPRSLPTVTPRELEAMKARLQSEISALKATLSGRDAEVASLAGAVADAERRVGEVMEEMRRERAGRDEVEERAQGLEGKVEECERVVGELRFELEESERERERLIEMAKEVEGVREGLETKVRELEGRLEEARKSTSEGIAAGARSSGEGKFTREEMDKEIQDAVQKVAKDLHRLYREKHEKKVAALKESYAHRWEKRLQEAEEKLRAALKGKEQPPPASAPATATKQEPSSSAPGKIELERRIVQLENEMTALRADNEGLRRQLEVERVEKGELVAAVDEWLALQQQGPMDVSMSTTASASASASAPGSGSGSPSSAEAKRQRPKHKEEDEEAMGVGGEGGGASKRQRREEKEKRGYDGAEGDEREGSGSRPASQQQQQQQQQQQPHQQSQYRPRPQPQPRPQPSLAKPQLQRSSSASVRPDPSNPGGAASDQATATARAGGGCGGSNSGSGSGGVSRIARFAAPTLGIREREQRDGAASSSQNTNSSSWSSSFSSSSIARPRAFAGGAAGGGSGLGGVGTGTGLGRMPRPAAATGGYAQHGRGDSRDLSGNSGGAGAGNGSGLRSGILGSIERMGMGRGRGREREP